MRNGPAIAFALGIILDQSIDERLYFGGDFFAFATGKNILFDIVKHRSFPA
tara:strand:+ start:443 stop:595 length:153 start_codon:yes stop_codon:yes gene_type:complete